MKINSNELSIGNSPGVFYFPFSIFHFFSWHLCLLCVFALNSLAQPHDAKIELILLTPSKTFTGWEGNKDFWQYKDGAFIGGYGNKKVPHNDFLCTKQQFTNFVLTLKFKLTGSNGFVNGGVQFRSQRVPNNFECTGYQADMGDPSWWGCLYDESRRNKVLVQSPMKEVNKVLKRNDWNDYKIRCEGKHIQLWINNVKTVDYTETDPNIPDYGIIGLQVHGGGITQAAYKDVVIEPL